MLSVLRPKFSGALGEALDVAARWSGDVVSPKTYLFSCITGIWFVLLLDLYCRILYKNQLLKDNHFC